MILDVFVPRPGAPATLGIRPGSGIVGSSLRDWFARQGSSPTLANDADLVCVDYEGNLYDTLNMRSYEERLLHAADRHTWNNGRGYPTIARRWVPREQLTAVGYYDTNTHYLHIFSDCQSLVDDWCRMPAEAQP